MLFNSLSYAVFLPIVFAIYWILPDKYRWVLLLVSSYWFYMSWKPGYVVLILFTTVVSYVAGLLIEKQDKQKSKKIVLVTACVLCLLVLFFFKYFNFFSESIAKLLSVVVIPVDPVVLDLLLQNLIM